VLYKHFLSLGAYHFKTTAFLAKMVVEVSKDMQTMTIAIAFSLFSLDNEPSLRDMILSRIPLTNITLNLVQWYMVDKTTVYLDYAISRGDNFLDSSEIQVVASLINSDPQLVKTFQATLTRVIDTEQVTNVNLDFFKKQLSLTISCAFITMNLATLIFLFVRPSLADRRHRCAGFLVASALLSASFVLDEIEQTVAIRVSRMALSCAASALSNAWSQVYGLHFKRNRGHFFHLYTLPYFGSFVASLITFILIQVVGTFFLSL
jgi:hypothetical protein